VNSDDAKEKLDRSNAALLAYPDCAYHLVRRAGAIQLQNTDEGPSLEDAESALLLAHQLDDRYIEALCDLAHFYDIILPNPERAKHFASLCLAEAEQIRDEMNEVLRDNP
jgi:hypothetical protein